VDKVSFAAASADRRTSRDIRFTVALEPITDPKFMSRLFSFAFVLVFICALSAAASAQQAPAFKISGIKAMLYYEQTGTFSKDILADPNISLWNTIIGEGSSGGASSATLVLVEVTGKAGAYETTRKVEMTATFAGTGRNGHPPVKRTSEIGILGDNGKFYVPLWLYDTGCVHVTIAARIVGQRQTSSMQKTIKFECGE
jgi:hypothetical protein